MRRNRANVHVITIIHEDTEDTDSDYEPEDEDEFDTDDSESVVDETDSDQFDGTDSDVSIATTTGLTDDDIVTSGDEYTDSDEIEYIESEDI
jgi:hypothetical protein